MIGGALVRLEALGGEQVLPDVGPLGKSLPDGREVFSGLLVRREHQHLLRPRERHIVQPHAVEEGDAVLGLERRPATERAEVAVDLLGSGHPRRERADHDHRELQPLGLMDGHHLYVALGEWPIRILVFVDAAVVEKAQEAVEEMEADVFAVPVRDHRIVVVTLKDVQKLGENGEVSSRALLPDGAHERLQGEQLVEVVGRAQIERLPLLKVGDLCRPPPERLRERMRSAETPAEPDQGVVHIARQTRHCTADLSAPVAVPAKQNRIAGDQIADFGYIEEGTGPGAEGGDALGMEGRHVGAAVVFADAVQQERHLVVVGDDPVSLEERHEIGEPLGFITAAGAPDANDRRIVGVLSPGVHSDGLVVAE